MNRFLVSLPDEYLAELDRTAKENSRSRNDLVREAIVVMLDEKRHLKERLERREAAWRDIDHIRATIGRRKPGDLDSTDLLRRFRHGDEQ